MIRKIIAGLLLAFAAAGCNPSEPADGYPDDDSELGEADSELTAREGEPCGGIAGIQCEKGLFCNFPVETACGSGDQQGTCEAPPQACILVMKLVCGCDGQTYNNACAAAQAEVSVLHDGACK